MIFALSTAVAFTPDACPFGVNSHQASDAELQLAAAAGIEQVRFDMNWFQMEPQQGVYDWTIADRFIGTATGLGLDVFVTVAYPPAWVSPGCDQSSADRHQWCHNAVPTEAQWTSFLTAAVNRYGDDVKHWGMWNEPNLLQFFDGTRDQYVDTILVPGSDAVHAACADCLVLGPELANLRGADWDADEGQCLFGECRFNGWNHSLNEILAVAGDSIDIVTHHKYAGTTDELWSEALVGEWVVIQLTQGIKQITDTHVPGKPVWITETGMETLPGGDYTQQYAANQLTQMYTDIQAVRDGTYSNAPAWPELGRVYWYDLTDDPALGWEGDAYTWGLLESDLTPKLAYDAYHDVTVALNGCDEVPPTPPAPPPTAPPTPTPEETDPPAPEDTGLAEPPTPPAPPTDEEDTGAVDPGPQQPSTSGGCTVLDTLPSSTLLGSGWLRR